MEDGVTFKWACSEQVALILYNLDLLRDQYFVLKKHSIPE